MNLVWLRSQLLLHVPIKKSNEVKSGKCGGQENDPPLSLLDLETV